MSTRMKHNDKIRRMTVAIAVAASALLLTLGAVFYLASCTDTLNGETYENQKPIVYFANIPPEGGSYSRNEVVYWYGSDPDGLIHYYRYHVAKVAEVGLMAPEDYALKLDDTDWTYIGRVEYDTTWWQCRSWEDTVCLDSVERLPQDTTWDIMHIDTTKVDPSNPYSDTTILLSADLSNPVNSYVSQWVFLQAFDMEGLGSDIVFRLFSRNDHPPETRILPFENLTPYVNAPTAGGIVTGVKLSWSGSDRIDYPNGDWPPFEFQWRLYGPYDSSGFKNLVDSFVRPVLVTSDGYVYDKGDTVVHCDTIYGDSVRVECDTAVVDSGMASVPWGHLEWKFYIDDQDFINSSTCNKLVDSSFDGTDTWVSNTSDVIYNVYKYAQSDTTVKMTFMFWIQSRDDAFVGDLIPAFDDFPVIDPRYEREVAVIDFTGQPSLRLTYPDMGLRMAYWKNAIEKWRPGTPFDTAGVYWTGLGADYINVPRVGHVPLDMLLKHKILIAYDDGIGEAQFAQAQEYSHNLYTAIDAGVNVWATWRRPLEVSGNEFNIPSSYLWYFGVTRMVFSNWACYAMAICGKPTGCDADRIEDFIGAYALDSLQWPNLEIDTASLHHDYTWDYVDNYGCPEYNPEHPGIPDVNWSAWRTSCEVLYLYKSFYGPDHPLGGMYNMEGNPVAHRLNTSLFRTVHFNFTPLAIQTDSVQKVIDKVLDWLYPSSLSSPTSKIRYPEAAEKISVSQARARYWQRCEELSPEEKPERVWRRKEINIK